MYTYQAYGLNIASEIEFSPLPTGDFETPDMTIRYGDVPEALDEVAFETLSFQLNDGFFLLNLPGIGRYLVGDRGSQITIQPDTTAHEDVLRVFLVDPILAAALHQRGRMPLRGACVKTPAGAALITGVSLSGVSTIAALLGKRGFPLLSGEISLIEEIMSDSPVAVPGYPAHWLYPDVLLKLNCAREDFKPLRSRLNRYVVPFGDQFYPEPLPVCSIYILVTNRLTQDVIIQEVKGLQKLQQLQKAPFFAFYEDMPGENYMSRLMLLSNKVKVHTVEFQRTHATLDLVVARLEEALKHG